MNAIHLFRRLAGPAIVMLAAGCAAPISKVETGQAVVRERLAVQVDEAWNRFDRGLADDTPTWTQEGFSVDALRFYVGIKDGQPIAPALNGSKAVPLTFKSGMQAEEIVALFQSLNTRDGSTFQMQKLEPAEFVGSKGFRFEYTVVRKTDDVRLAGVAYGAVRLGELFLISYSAPRLGFFAKHSARVEAMAKGASVLGS